VSKRASSRSIEQFIRHVDRGLITGKELSSGPHVLKDMRDALQAILDGEDHDQALGITRKTGPEAAPYSLPLAIMVHQWRGGPKPEKWIVVEDHANKLLGKHGYEPLSLSRIKQIYKDQLPRVYAYMNIALFNDAIDIINKQKAGLTSEDRERRAEIINALKNR
jgi:hypothetical protein